MTQQKSENRIIPEERGNSFQTPSVEGGKAVPVNKVMMQLNLNFATAEYPRGVTAAVEADLSAPTAGEAPKAESSGEIGTSTGMMEEVTKQLTRALHKVVANKGAPGADGVTIQQFKQDWKMVHPKLAAALRTGTYSPGEIRRVEIPKASGGKRKLGIPNVVDRVVQEAIRGALEPLYEPRFHPNSHGFRPDRSSHTAIAVANRYLSDGLEIVVDLDLEKFFDRVCHQRLLARLAHRVSDKRLLKLIGQMLKSEVVLNDGMTRRAVEGVPQGGPLSPLLSNIVLDELDWELDRRGLHFVRYADDLQVFVRSVRAGERVMASLTRFIEGRLRLKVNAAKSAVSRSEERSFLGFRLSVDPLEAEVKCHPSPRSLKRIKARIRELTPRNWGGSMSSCIRGVNKYLRGWYGYFQICSQDAEYYFQGVDARIRRRLRALQLKQWKRKKTMARQLISLGVRRRTAWQGVYRGRQSLWKLSHTPAVNRGLRNAYFASRGLFSLKANHQRRHQAILAREQLTLFG